MFQPPKTTIKMTNLNINSDGDVFLKCFDYQEAFEKSGPGTAVASQWPAMSVEKDPVDLLCK